MYNMRRMLPSRHQSERTHCIHGHPFIEENTIIVHRKGRNPSRHCRECVRIRMRAYTRRLNHVDPKRYRVL